MQSKKDKIGYLIAFLAVIKITLHLISASGLGYFIDELYTIALSKHLAWGFVDLPPIVPALLAFSRWLFGESLFAVHLLPAIAGGATVVLVGLITKELGGRAFAVCLACLTFIFAPVWLTMNSFFAYDGFDQLALALFFYVLIRLINTNNKKLWICLGVCAGIAFMTKATILYYSIAIVLGFILSKRRKDFLTPMPYLGLFAFFIIISPFIIWQITNGAPTLEYWINYGADKTYKANIVEYFVTIILFLNPITLPLWVLGIYSLVKDKNYRVIGIMFLAALTFLFLLRAKAYMISAFFIPLFAGGAVYLEQLTKNKKAKWLKSTSIAIVLLFGILLAPMSIPILSPQQLTLYFNTFGILNKSVTFDNAPKVVFPQTLADRFGWDNMVGTVADVYHSLPQDEQKKCAIFAGYYGAAGAIDLLGKQYGLPNAISGHLSYYLWGYGNYNGEVVIVIGEPFEKLKEVFGSVEQKETIVSEYTMPYNTNLPVYVCRRLKFPINEFWASVKKY